MLLCNVLLSSITGSCFIVDRNLSAWRLAYHYELVQSKSECCSCYLSVLILLNGTYLNLVADLNDVASLTAALTIDAN